jgi:WD40 repeat protein
VQNLNPTRLASPFVILHLRNSHESLVVLQAVTTGTDRKIAYWDVYDGSAVRVVDACEEAAMCDVSVDVLGEAIVSGGANKLVQVWGYDQGYCYFVGVGHSRAVNRVRISPDRLFIVSVGSEGGIFIWKYVAPGHDDTLDRTAALVTAPAHESDERITAAV